MLLIAIKTINTNKNMLLIAINTINTNKNILLIAINGSIGNQEKGKKPTSDYSKDSFFSLLRSISASLLRMESLMEQVLSNCWSMMRGFISFTMRITSFIIG